MTCRYLLAVLLLAAPATAQGPSDLAHVEIGDLMRIEVQRVFGASEPPPHSTMRRHS